MFGLGLVQFLVAVIVIAAVLAIVYVALKHMGIAIPPVVVTIFWILVVAVFAIWAIKFLVSAI